MRRPLLLTLAMVACGSPAPTVDETFGARSATSPGRSGDNERIAALEAQTAALNEQLAAALGAIAALQTENDALEGQVAALTVQIDGATHFVDDWQGELSALADAGGATGLRGDLDALEGQVAALAVQVDGATHFVDDWQGELSALADAGGASGLRGDLDALRADQAALAADQAALVAADATLTAAVADLGADQAALADVDDALDARLTGLNGEIGALRGAVCALESWAIGLTADPDTGLAECPTIPDEVVLDGASFSADPTLVGVDADTAKALAAAWSTSGSTGALRITTTSLTATGDVVLTAQLAPLMDKVVRVGRRKCGVVGNVTLTGGQVTFDDLDVGGDLKVTGGGLFNNGHTIQVDGHLRVDGGAVGLDGATLQTRGVAVTGGAWSSMRTTIEVYGAVSFGGASTSLHRQSSLLVEGGDLILRDDASITFTETAIRIGGGSLQVADASRSTFDSSPITIQGGSLLLEQDATFDLAAGTIEASGGLTARDAARLTGVPSAVSQSRTSGSTLLLGGDLSLAGDARLGLDGSVITVDGGNFLLHDRAAVTLTASTLVAPVESPLQGVLDLSGSSLVVPGGDLVFDDRSTVLLRDTAGVISGGNMYVHDDALLWLDATSRVDARLADDRGGAIAFDGVGWTLYRANGASGGGFLDGQVMYLTVRTYPTPDEHRPFYVAMAELAGAANACAADPTTPCDLQAPAAALAPWGIVLAVNSTKE